MCGLVGILVKGSQTAFPHTFKVCNKTSVMESKEIWKDIPGYEGWYQGSSLGRIRSLNRWVNGKNGTKAKRTGKILKPVILDGRYYAVSICNNGKKKVIKIHRLVAETFISNPNNKPQINHIDCDIRNNNVKNLEWCTALENNRHMVINDRANPPIGERNGISKLTRNDVIQIRKRIANGEIQRHLAFEYGVSPAQINRIKSGERWNHVKIGL